MSLKPVVSPLLPPSDPSDQVLARVSRQQVTSNPSPPPFPQHLGQAPLLVPADDGLLDTRRQQRQPQDSPDVAAVQVQLAGDVLDVAVASGIEGSLRDVGSGEGDEKCLLGREPDVAVNPACAVGYDDLLAAVVAAELHGDAEP